MQALAHVEVLLQRPDAYTQYSRCRAAVERARAGGPNPAMQHAGNKVARFEQISQAAPFDGAPSGT